MSELHQSNVLVRFEGMSAFQARLKSLNAKAAKFGLVPVTASEPTLVRFQVHREERSNGSGIDIALQRLPRGARPEPGVDIVRMAEFEIRYPIIKLGEWRVVAQIEALPQGNLIFSVSSSDRDRMEAERHRDSPICCEHCGTQRRRNASYLLSDDAGSYKEVGQTCLKDFTGIDPAAVLFLAQLHSFMSFEDFEPGSLRRNCIDTRDFLVNVSFLAESKGFVSASRARESGQPATYEIASQIDRHLTSTEKRALADAYDRLGAQADAIRTWYALAPESVGFEANVKTLLASDDILLDTRHLAFAAGAVPGYLHARDRRRRAEERAREADTLGHVGEKGAKATMRLSLDRIVAFESAFGPMWRMNFRDEKGNRLTWKTATAPSEEMREAKPGAQFDGQFRVKAHTEYNGVPQTEITHLKIAAWVPVLEPEAEPVSTP